MISNENLSKLLLSIVKFEVNIPFMNFKAWEILFALKKIHANRVNVKVKETLRSSFKFGNNVSAAIILDV